jgi:protein-L-isoaspartate(D-aspartate) O-methyltransferase
MDFAAARQHMVARQIEQRGIRHPRVLAAMAGVPREAFVPEDLAEFAYDDAPLPIGSGQTISQPYVVALMIAAAEPGPSDHALEVGTGSGYAGAVLSRVVADVTTIERHAALAASAQAALARLHYDNVRVVVGDGTRGWQERAPYDVIMVTAGGPEAPRSLLNQLAIGGRLVIPIGPTPRLQRLVRVVRRDADHFERKDLGAVQFVPLVGAEGWAAGGKPPARAPRRGVVPPPRDGTRSPHAEPGARAGPEPDGSAEQKTNGPAEPRP